MKPPVLLDMPESFDTERLTIRAPRFGDGPAINEAIRETFDDLQRWMPWAQTVPTVEESEEFSRHSRASFIDRRDFGLRLWLKGTETLVGSSGLHVRDWDIPAFEIGYWCRKRFEGQGYISEAVRAITRFGFETLNAERIVIRCDALNARSAAVARRCGYTLEGIHRHEIRAHDTNELRDMMHFAILRSEFNP